VHIIYYITSHGFGHGVRACAVANCFSPDVKLTFRTSLPLQFFREEMQREFTYLKGEFDCGCVQSDGVTVDIEKTVDTYSSISAQNEKILECEVSLCKETGVDAVVSDITPFAFDVAQKLGVPSFAVTNFTWYDIYKEYVEFRPDFEPVLRKIKNQYHSADLLLALEPPCPMDYFRKKMNVPVVGRRGVNRRTALNEKLGIDENKKIGLIYVGNFGMDTAEWKKIELLTEWEFIGVQNIPGNPANYSFIDKSEFRYQDLTASVDVMICKIGYGAVSECFINGTPMLYLQRDHFAEYPYLEDAVKKWGFGYKISTSDFYEINWEQALNKAVTNGKTSPLDSNGGAICAGEIERAVNSKRVFEEKSIPE
jgi:hypothetical protein